MDYKSKMTLRELCAEAERMGLLDEHIYMDVGSCYYCGWDTEARVTVGDVWENGVHKCIKVVSSEDDE